VFNELFWFSRWKHVSRRTLVLYFSLYYGKNDFIISSTIVLCTYVTVTETTWIPDKIILTCRERWARWRTPRRRDSCTWSFSRRPPSDSWPPARGLPPNPFRRKASWTGRRAALECWSQGGARAQQKPEKMDQLFYREIIPTVGDQVNPELYSYFHFCLSWMLQLRFLIFLNDRL